ncbi:unnamed protein product [Cladocopium goreaui]|uniref:TauD/TfdA-like domain-containing protein n=1 Tax=Cladocopium goreaui TaxID=2562237 RepID=A0A9P1CRV5_9DINO|nr:unnamed protein product [Cladocopium goreaui]
MNTNTDIIDQLIGHFLGHLHPPVPRVPQGPLLHWKTLGSHGFGAVVIGLKAKDLQSSRLRRALVDLWRGRKGLLVLKDLPGLTPDELLEFTSSFGSVEEALAASRSRAQVTHPGRAAVPGVVMRLGNSRDPTTNELNASFTLSAQLPTFSSGPEACRFNPSTKTPIWHTDGTYRLRPPTGSMLREPTLLGNFGWSSSQGRLPTLIRHVCQFDSVSRQPNWHTDATFRERPPTGSMLYAVQVPPVGGDTCFADASKAFTTLPKDTQRRLEGLEALCSQAHHDALHNVKKPGTYVLMNAEQRAKMPLMAVPLVLTHPETKRKSLYGANSSVFLIQPLNSPAPLTELLNRAEGAEAFEDPSVDRELRSLLPHATGPDFVVRWHWNVGDLVIWDNRCTMHCATGFDHETFVREMWRTTFHDMSWQPPVRKVPRE